MLLQGFYPATILSYDKVGRTAKVRVDMLCEGAEDGLTATFAYPIGDDDGDTERQILANADVYVFFEGGQPHAPVVWANRSHGVGAVVDVRRIRQENIELLATQNITLQATDTIVIHGENVVINAGSSVSINSPITTVDGDMGVTGTLTAQTLVAIVDALIASKSFNSHIHRLIPSNAPVTPPTL